MKKLSARQEKFVNEYVSGQNAAQAAVRAGYNYGHADRLIADPAIKAEIDKRLKAVEEKAEVSRAYVLARLKEVVERCMTAEQVMEFNHETKEMEPTGEWQFDSTGANRALELLGKTLKMFTDRTEHDVGEDFAEILREVRERKKNAK